MVNLLFVCYLGGLFHDTEEQEQLVFQYTIQTINSDSNVLPKTLVPLPVRVLPHDSLSAANTGGHIESTLEVHGNVMCTIWHLSVFWKLAYVLMYWGWMEQRKMHTVASASF
jgi:hypothetical protein